eukprot:scaffold1524_cov232-Chaetoceros_neogracile.AAC.5
MVNFQNYRGCFVPPLRSQNLQHQLPSKALNAMLPFSTSLVATETVDAIQTFEPQVNTPALSAFLVIAIEFIIDHGELTLVMFIAQKCIGTQKSGAQQPETS